MSVKLKPPSALAVAQSMELEGPAPREGAFALQVGLRVETLLGSALRVSD